MSRRSLFFTMFLGACGTGSTEPDAETVIPSGFDARPGTPDARPTADARAMTDARPMPDSRPGEPDARPMPDARVPDARPPDARVPDARPGTPDAPICTAGETRCANGALERCEFTASGGSTGVTP